MIKSCVLKYQYPNPIVGLLNLEYTCTLDEIFKVSVYNLMNNELVYTGEMENEIFTLDVSNWQSGFYSIIVNDTNGKVIYKSSTKIKN